MVRLRVRHGHWDYVTMARNNVNQVGSSQFLGGYNSRINQLLSRNYDSTPVVGCWVCGHIDHKFFDCSYPTPLSMEEKFYFRAYGIMLSEDISQTDKEKFYTQFKDNLYLDNLTSILRRHFLHGEPLGHVMEVPEPAPTIQMIIDRRPQARGPRYPCLFDQCEGLFSQYGYVVHVKKAHLRNEMVADLAMSPALVNLEHFKPHFQDTDSSNMNFVVSIKKMQGRHFAICINMDKNFMRFYVVSLFYKRQTDPNFNYLMSIVSSKNYNPEAHVVNEFIGSVYPIGTKNYNAERGAFEIPKARFPTPLDLNDVRLRVEIGPVLPH